MRYEMLVALLLCASAVDAKQPPELVIKSANTHVHKHHSMQSRYLLNHNNDYDKCVFTPEQMKGSGYNTLNPIQRVKGA